MLQSRRIYNRIQVLRTERGLSRKDLAEKIQVNFQTIGYLERGEYNPSLDLAFRIGELFGLPIEAIFSTQPMRPLSEDLYVPGERRREIDRDGQKNRH
ncbi:MAG: helix-turn-helix transcriptional regulator [Planctomycetes bacterium]|nr:helix-turn-helix transcriptional regulator [Planctomycetota bacterium]